MAHIVGKRRLAAALRVDGGHSRLPLRGGRGLHRRALRRGYGTRTGRRISRLFRRLPALAVLLRGHVGEETAAPDSVLETRASGRGRSASSRSTSARRPSAPGPKPASQVQNPRGDFFANMTSQQYRESRKTAEKPAYTPAGARPVSAPQSAPVKPAPAPQWQTRVPAIDTQSGGKAALSDYVRHETPASAPVLSAQQSQPVESLSILWKTMTTRSSRYRCRRKTPAPS